MTPDSASPGPAPPDPASGGSAGTAGGAAAELTPALRRLAAVVFDTDGVITDSARVHAAAWKEAFDACLAEHLPDDPARGRPFDPVEDYRRHVDGKARIDGAAAFLESRGLRLPHGDPADAPGTDTVWAVAARKEERFTARLREHGIAAWPGTVRLLHALRSHGVPCAAVSASRHARDLLAGAGVLGLFSAVVDGNEAARLRLAGKPEPALFLEAARRLETAPGGAAVVEDALAGVEAGRRGGFALVVGVDRTAGPTSAEDLRRHGADLVVRDLAELLETADTEPEHPAAGGTGSGARRSASRSQPPGAAAWTWGYDGYQPHEERLRESLCTLGNGYFATRGAAPEEPAGQVHYPGTYAAGCYNRLVSEVAGRRVENEDMVNLPNWLPLRFRIRPRAAVTDPGSPVTDPGSGDAGPAPSVPPEDDDAVGAPGPWLSPDHPSLTAYRQALDLRRGVLTRWLSFRDPAGRSLDVEQRRLVHMADPHLAGLHTVFTARGWSGEIDVESALDGTVVNGGVARYRDLEGRHLRRVRTGGAGPHTVWLECRTSSSGIRVALAARLQVRAGEEPVSPRPHLSGPVAAHRCTAPIAPGEPVTADKTVALHTSRDPAISDPLHAAVDAAGRAPGFAGLLESHTAAWDRLWRRTGLDVPAESGRILRLHLFHVLQTLSPHTAELDAGVPARGLHGEAYRGHVFWDELFVLPFLNLHFPEVSRALLGYRHRRLPQALRSAADTGRRGAMYPWQSGSDGREETQTLHLNPRSGRWLPDHSRLQHHVGSAVAYNAWRYAEATGDEEFLHTKGAEMVLQVARFWADAAVLDPDLDRYRIRGVVGPDEYHDAYPDAVRPGLDDNAYTNVTASWVLARALELAGSLPGPRRGELFERIGLGTAELERWRDISRRLHVPFHDGVVSQFAGYGGLAELDWAAYRARYGDIRRLDRILEAEGDSSNRYQASKQADVLMLGYLFSPGELAGLFHDLGYRMDDGIWAATVDYYLRRTSHGSTLSGLVHGWVLARVRRAEAWTYCQEALEGDVADLQGGTTGEGVHLGAMAGTLDLVQRGLTGLETRQGALWLDPAPLPELSSYGFSLRYRGHWGVQLRMAPGQLGITVPESAEPPIRVMLADRSVTLAPGESAWLRLPGG